MSSKRLDAQKLGQAGEAAAKAFLEAKGLRCVAHNVRYRLGELDLVMQEGECLVFVEVRVRTQQQYGDAAASITPSKQRKVVRAVQRYCQAHGVNDRVPLRIDVLALRPMGAQDFHIEWIKNAFSE